MPMLTHVSDSTKPPAGETPSFFARAQLARSILNHRLADGCTEGRAELAVYEARLALDGHSLEAITAWHQLATR